MKTSERTSQSDPEGLSAVVSISERSLGRSGSDGSNEHHVAPSCLSEARSQLSSPKGKRKDGRRALERQMSAYLKNGVMYSADSMKHPRWEKRKQKVALCGTDASSSWHSGKRGDGKVFCGPAPCHAKEHTKCRPSEAADRINELEPITLLTLTDRRKCFGKHVRDARLLTNGKRLKRFFGLLRKRFGPFAYVWVLELHQSGFPHVHIVLDIGLPSSEVSFEFHGPSCACDKCTLSEMEAKESLTLLAGRSVQREISAMWRICGGGWNVRWELLQKDGRYIEKYLDDTASHPEDVRALLAINKIRSWSCSKGLKRPVSRYPLWHYKRGKPEAAVELARESTVAAQKVIESSRLDARRQAEEWASKREKRLGDRAFDVEVWRNQRSQKTN